MRHIRNQAAALAVIALLASCTNDDSQTRTEDPSPTGGGSPTDATEEPDYTVLGVPHVTGPGRWAVHAFGDPEAPLAVFDVPAGFQGHESFVWSDTGQGTDRQFVQLTYWRPTRVLADPCDVERPRIRLGPTVEDLAEAIAAQERTTTTRPVEVTLAGYRGLYLELSSPKRLDYGTCTSEGGMVIWEAGREASRVLEDPVTDRYWILDVGGQRVVVTAMTLPDPAREAVRLLFGIVESATFVAAG